jgi:ATP-dependent Lhr-like helicase
VVYDRDTGTLTARRGAQRLAVTSGGAIPDRGLFTVYLASNADSEKPSRVGELDEEMVYESRPGDVISLGATSWRITEITHDRVLVIPAPGEPARLPFWRGDSVGRPAELGAAVGAFTGELARLHPPHSSSAAVTSVSTSPRRRTSGGCSTISAAPPARCRRTRRC